MMNDARFDTHETAEPNDRRESELCELTDAESEAVSGGILPALAFAVLCWTAGLGNAY